MTAQPSSAHDVARGDSSTLVLVRGALVFSPFRRIAYYIPFEQDAANLFFQPVSSRYEHASLILTSNLAFAR